ncbi:MAG: hypothetical protein RMJ07_00150 [Nitrososphaerota archaeon]|nr:hypothetical protein [Candidatus Bathyarchaeota archaeon]MDW8048084.1 hypothetical protein [Nitrososphaerota archaeon]
MNRRKRPQSNAAANLSVEGTVGHLEEVCKNPWDGECRSTDIALYIMYKGKQLPVCKKCWKTISSKNIEWMYD